MGTDATISIALIIAVVGFFITVYNFNTARKKDALTEESKMEDIRTACLKANMKLDAICSQLTGLQTDVKALQQDNSNLDTRLTILEHEHKALKESLGQK